MVELTMHQKSMMSHLDARVSRLYGRFFLNPFQFYGEKEIHYIFANELQELIEKDHKWRGAKLLREFTSSIKYSRDIDGRLTIDDGGRRAYIDIVIKHPNLSIGFEFYLAKETKPDEFHYGNRYYHLRKSPISPKKAIIHAKNDILRLSNEKELDVGYMILFIAGFSDSESDYQRFKNNKSKPILEALESLSKFADERIRILYCERYCLGTLKGEANILRKQFGY